MIVLWGVNFGFVFYWVWLDVKDNRSGKLVFVGEGKIIFFNCN